MKLPPPLRQLALDVAIELRRRTTKQLDRRDAFDNCVDSWLIAKIDPNLTKTAAQKIVELRKALRLAKRELKMGITCCDEALSGTWDVSGDDMEGFEAWKEQHEKALVEIGKVL